MLTVTGELLGFSRPYARRSEAQNEAQAVHRKVLLTAFATLSWVAVGSLAGIASIFAASSAKGVLSAPRVPERMGA